MLTLPDDELIDAQRELNVGTKVSLDVKRQLRYLSTWREAVWLVEARNGQVLTSLVDAGLGFALVSEGVAAEQIERHVRVHFEVEMSKAPRGTWFEIRDWCDLQVRQFGVLPLWLRTMKKPKGGVPMQRPAEPKADGGQEQLW